MGGDMGESIGGLVTIFGVLFLFSYILGYLFIIMITRAILGVFHKVNPRTKNYISVTIPPLLIGCYIILTSNPLFILALSLPTIFISGITLLVMNRLFEEARA